MQITIGKLAAAGDVGVETIRYYQRRGLIGTPARSGGEGWGGGIRRYDENDVRRLKFIRSAQAAGFTLEEIGGLLMLSAQRNEDMAELKQAAQARLQTLDARIAELQRVRTGLQQLVAVCPGHGALAQCPILSALTQD